MKKRIIAATILVAGLALTGCGSAAEKTSENLSTAADNFEIQRTVIFFPVNHDYRLPEQGKR